MNRITSTAALLMFTAACAKSPVAPTERQPDPQMAALAALMKNQINPAFSKLMFLVFHGDDMQEEPMAVRAEMQRFTNILRTSISELRDWRELPTYTEEGRGVFITYAANVDKQTQTLFDAIERSDRDAAATQMQEIADTCNNCHHFFRLEIEDSVVPGAK